MTNGLCKAERLHRKLIIDRMFAGGNARSFSIYPLRIVYMPADELDATASVLISVPKKRFKRAVKRNYIKRQIREGYRLNKHDLCALLATKGQKLAIAFIYQSDELCPTAEIADTVHLLLTRITEKMS